MRFESHVSSVKARVRGSEISRHGVLELEAGRAFVFAAGLGFARQWPLMCETAMQGFAQGFERGRKESAKRKLEWGIADARAAIERALAASLENIKPDVTLTALALEGTELHVANVGATRVYLHRKGSSQRLTPREDPPEGIARGRASTSATQLEPGDLVIAGTLSAFTVPAVSKVTSLFQSDPSAPPALVASILLEPAAKSGIGASVVVGRMK